MRLYRHGVGRCLIEIKPRRSLCIGVAKLLANSDRWADRSVYSRDLIDLAMMQPSKKLLRSAMAKARGAYGDSIVVDLSKAIGQLRDNPHRLDECMRKMGMASVPKAVLWTRIKALERAARPSGA